MTDVAATVRNARRRFGESTFGKLLTLSVLVLLLLIPVVRVTSLVRERMGRQAQVQYEIAGSWGGSQTLVGPILAVPYTGRHEEKTFEKTVVGASSTGGSASEVRTLLLPKTVTHDVQHMLHTLPTQLAWQATVEPEIRYRGLFEVVVYEARLRVRGTFELPSIEGESTTPHWDRAALVLGLPEVRGLQQRARLTWDGEEIDFLPGTGGSGRGGVAGADKTVQVVGEAIHASLPDLTLRQPTDGSVPETIPFEFELALRGSGDLQFLPLGEETVVDLSGPWSSPGFNGAFLPKSREIGAQGFTARWEVPYFGRSYPQTWIDDEVDLSQLIRSAFGAELVLPADGYQQTERSVKYAVLFIVLTFGTFFLLETLSPVRLHAMHYLLVGSALVLFYVLLLALSEHLGFPPAYAIASVATAGLISAYSRSILASRRWAVTVAGCLAVLYGYLYVLLQLEDYSLLLGAVGLFVTLAVVMRLTRRLDWGNRRNDASQTPAEV